MKKIEIWYELKYKYKIHNIKYINLHIINIKNLNLDIINIKNLY